MKQQCYMFSIYLNWAIYLGGFAYLAAARSYLIAALWLVLLPVAMWAYVRTFPRYSAALGYGSVADERNKTVASTPAQTKVRLYVALGCPFCPLVENRLEALQRGMEFQLETIDVTYRPELLAKKGIRAVPVVEVGEKRIVGHATSDQLAALIAGDGRAA